MFEMPTQQFDESVVRHWDSSLRIEIVHLHSRDVLSVIAFSKVGLSWESFAISIGLTGSPIRERATP
jgi:hypothetical protein